ncbi:WecB/TagA/CpsF family glycosyltransferase [Stutzerimonas zhaodongensis]|uniref:WecB/TagA/CpsF family glycosyltransferase n=1 Tax=Stutzerimonas zhaodongensis TaxID=1176257 RepID=UPI002104BAA7|nr:WecB/TagA/CpsF family glycosyltransferase [Stutzerimonas zhaodongensis]MCQ2028708.1 WecB/TagA/CpsF family glycosyltransferase [Stutzerimonas zhaodongensis]
MKNPLARRTDPLIDKLKLLTEDDTRTFMSELKKRESPTILGFLNQHGYNIAQRDQLIFKSFMQVNYLLRDGIGIKLACIYNGIDPKANLNGSDFIPELVDELVGESEDCCELFAMGTREPWLSDGARNLFGNRKFHAIDGFQETEDYLKFYRKHHVPGRFPIIVLAMGMPKQEQVALHLQQAMDTKALLICGGAILDFTAARFPRAPLIFRKFGLEWAFRMLIEPRRLFKRYAIGIPIFFYYLLRNAFSGKPQVAGWSALKREQ